MEGFEEEIGARTDTVRKIAATLEKAGIEFFNSGSPGVRLRLGKR
jgi:hypothetical protein